jgi:hypothetical protein
MNLFDKLEAQRVAIEAKRVANQQYTAAYNEAKHKQALEQANAYIERALALATPEQFCRRCISKSHNFGYISTIDPEYVPGCSNYKENPFTADVITELKATYQKDGGSLDVGVHDDWGCILVTVVVKW